MHKIKIFFALMTILLTVSCKQQNGNTMGTYGYDVTFFKRHNIKIVELSSKDGLSKIMIIPSYQGRVMTSTSDGDNGGSYGWINYKLIDSGQISKQFNPVGGEERFWLGPEGGSFSLYFKNGEEQVFENWKVPAVIDTDSYDIKERGENYIIFTKKASLINASKTEFNIGIERKISLLNPVEIEKAFGFKLSKNLQAVSYQTESTITNLGKQAWTKEGGLVSVWLLCMFNPTSSTTVFIPYNTGIDGAVVNDEYFGKVPSERLIQEDGMIYFKIDGKYRSKIGLPADRAKGLCASYDSDKKILTLLWCSMPTEPRSYLNGQWGEQTNPYQGDVINSYNDGPIADGSIMGPFYEIETSSPGADLSVNQSLTHIQRVLHIQGDEQELARIVRDLFNIDLDAIITKFDSVK